MSSRFNILRFLTLILAFTALNVAFTNCAVPIAGDGAFSSKNSKSIVSTGSNYNGGGYAGKVNFLFYAANPVCATAPLVADEKIELVDGVYYQTSSSCAGTANTQAVLPFTNPYNPFYLVYDNKVFFRDASFTSTPAGARVNNYALCTNIDNQIDVAIRVEKYQDAAGVWRWVTKGQLIKASSTAPGYVFHEEVGRLHDPTPSGTVVFGDDNHGENPIENSFMVKLFKWGSAAKIDGEITLRSANGSPDVVLPAECYNLRDGF